MGLREKKKKKTAKINKRMTRSNMRVDGAIKRVKYYLKLGQGYYINTFHLFKGWETGHIKVGDATMRAQNTHSPITTKSHPPAKRVANHSSVSFFKQNHTHAHYAIVLIEKKHENKKLGLKQCKPMPWICCNARQHSQRTIKDAKLHWISLSLLLIHVCCV